MQSAACIGVLAEKEITIKRIKYELGTAKTD